MSKASSRDAAFLTSVFKHMKTQPTVSSCCIALPNAYHVQIDWAAVTAEMGLKNIRTTQTRYGQIKNKLQVAAGPQINKRSRSPIDDEDIQQMSDKISLPKRPKNGTARSSTVAASRKIDKRRSCGSTEIKTEAVEAVKSEPSDDSEEFMQANTDEEDAEF